MLHRWRIDDREYARHEARRGRRHGFDEIVPEHTALVVVDMVPFFVEENLFARGVVANINRLAVALRVAGGTVAWVLPSPSPTAAHREFYGDAVSAVYQQSGDDGPLRSRLATGLSTAADDIYVEKTAASAFYPGRCDLQAHLDQRDIDTVLVVGTVANVCCESTVRDASTLGYRTTMVADANAAIRDADLNATLHTIYRSFGDVRTTDELIDLIGAMAPPIDQVDAATGSRSTGSRSMSRSVLNSRRKLDQNSSSST